MGFFPGVAGLSIQPARRIQLEMELETDAVIEINPDKKKGLTAYWQIEIRAPIPT